MTKLSPHRTCETTGEIELWCDHCDLLEFGRRTVTALHRADRDPGTRWLNEHAEKRLRRTLAHLPDRYAEACRILAGERKGGSGGRTPPASRPPLDIDVLDLTRRGQPHPDPIAHATGRSRGLLTMLESWVRLAHGEMLDSGNPATDPVDVPTIASETGWLLRHIVWVLEQQWVQELRDDLDQADKDLRRALSERPEYQPRCLRCGNRLEEHVGYYACPACGQDYREEAALRTMAARAHPMTPAQIERGFGIPASTVRSWDHRGHLEPACGDDGQPLTSGKSSRYHLTDVLRLRDTGLSA